MPLKATLEIGKDYAEFEQAVIHEERGQTRMSETPFRPPNPQPTLTPPAPEPARHVGSRAGRLMYAIVGVTIVAAAAYAYASPYLTFSRVRAAALRGDAETVNAHIDFPALRQSFKDWIGAAMTKEMVKSDMRGNPFATFGMAMAMVMADKMVEAMVTPASVSMMLQGRRPQPQVIGTTSQEPKTPSDTTTEMGYETLDRFVVKVSKKGNPDDSFTMVWARSGLTWKLSAVRFSGPSPSSPSEPSKDVVEARPTLSGQPEQPPQPESTVQQPPQQPAQRPRWLVEQIAQEEKEARQRASETWQLVVTVSERKVTGDVSDALNDILTNPGKFQSQFVVASSLGKDQCRYTAARAARESGEEAIAPRRRYDQDTLVIDQEDGATLVSEHSAETGGLYRTIRSRMVTVRVWKCLRQGEVKPGQ